jgi:hypothetical protein
MLKSERRPPIGVQGPARFFQVLASSGPHGPQPLLSSMNANLRRVLESKSLDLKIRGLLLDMAKCSEPVGQKGGNLAYLQSQQSSREEPATPSPNLTPKPLYTLQSNPTARGKLIRSESQKEVRLRPNEDLRMPRSISMPNLNDRSAYNRCIGQTVLVLENAQGKKTASKRIEEFDNLLNGI